MPEISILICTRGRPDSLEATLRSVGRASIPTGWLVEVIVVDNGPTDATRRVVESASVAGVPPRYLVEPRQGQGYAYNTGIAAARSDFLLFTDDDVRVPANWIEGMSAPLLADQFDAVAGAVVFPPRIAYALSRRPFVSRRHWFASSDYLDPDRPAAMIGANMAFHRRVLQKGVAFDLELGAGASGFHQESLFSVQLVEAGFRLGGAFDVAVEHHFDLSRLTRAGMLNVASRMGRSRAFVDYHWNHVQVRVPRLQKMLAAGLAIGARAAERLRLGPGGVVSGPLLRFTHDEAYYEGYLLQRKRERKYQRRPSAK